MSKNPFTQELLDTVGDDVAAKLSSQNLLTPEQTAAALSALSPVVLGSLKKKQEDLGESEFETLLDQAGASEDSLDQLDDVLDQTTPNTDITPLLDSKEQDQTVMALSKKLGIGGTAAKKLLPMLVPVILGMLMKKGKTQSGGSSSRSSGLTAILDRDGDGSVLDDIAGMVLGGGQKRGGFFQMILAMIFGRK